MEKKRGRGARNRLTLGDVIAAEAKKDKSFLARHRVAVLRKLVALSLRWAAEEAGLTQPGIAKRADLSQGEVSRVMNGKRNMTADKIDRLARAVGKRAVVLFVDESDVPRLLETYNRPRSGRSGLHHPA
ncbi:MAG: helix-turn-helix transcriptional regulator [Elusimicrobiota bacterium]